MICSVHTHWLIIMASSPGSAEDDSTEESVVARLRDTAQRTADGAKLHGAALTSSVDWKAMAGRGRNGREMASHLGGAPHASSAAVHQS